MKNIFIFGNGSKLPTITKKLISTLRENKFNVILNTEKDHKFLMKEYPFYKGASDNKYHAMMSDVWRSWIVSKRGGLYIDATSSITNSTIKRLNDIFSKKKYFLICEFNCVVTNSLFYLPKEHIILKESLKIYSKFTGSVLSGPMIYSILARKNKMKIKGNKGIGISVLSISEISGIGDALFNKKSLGSGGVGQGKDGVKASELFEAHKLSVLERMMSLFVKRPLLAKFVFLPLFFHKRVKELNLYNRVVRKSLR